MKMTMIPIVIGALGTVPKGLERGLKELEFWWRNETIQIEQPEHSDHSYLSIYVTVLSIYLSIYLSIILSINPSQVLHISVNSYL